MRVRRTLRPGTAWAAAAALIVAPLVVAPIVSAAEPGTDEANSSAPATVAASSTAAAAPAAEADPATAAASSEAPAAAAPSTQAAASSPASSAPTTAAAASSSAAPASSAAASSSAATQAAGKSAAAAPAAQSLESGSSDTGVSLLAAAAPGTLEATVVADRTNTGAARPVTGQASGVAGASLTLQVQTQTRTSSNGTWGNTSAWTDLSTCTSAASGLCSLDVPAIDNPNLKRYSSARINFTDGGPAGSALISVGTGNNGSSTTSIQYLTLTATALPTSGQTKQVSAIASGLSTGQQPVFTVVRTNPALIGQCGLKVGLLIDQSKSIADATNGVANLKAAANAFVDALTGTPSQILIRNFADSSPNHTASEAGLTSTATATDAQPLKSAIAAMQMGTFTNWDAGLWRMKGLGLDAVVVVTDGVPTANMNGTTNPNTGGYNSTVGTVQHAIWSANAVKADGATVIAVGAGDSFSNTGALTNLKAIASSGQHYVASDLAALKTTLKNLAEKSCQGTVNVVKRVMNDGATTTTEANSTAGVGFNFKMGAGAYQATNVTGGTSFAITSNGSQTFTEEQRSDFDIVAQGGMPAICKTSGGASVAVTKVSDYSWSIPTSTTSTITCTVYNKAKPKEASLTINHAWVDENNSPLTDAEVAAVLNTPVNGAPSLKVNSGTAWTNAPAYGDSVTTTTSGGSTKLVEGDNVTVAVRTVPGTVKSGYTCSTSLVSVAKGSSTNPASLTSALVAGSNAFTITHKLVCTTQLTLKKVVVGAPGDTTLASAWTLRSNGTAFTQGTAKAVEPGVANELTETGGPTAVANKAWEQTSLVCDVAGTLNGNTVKVPRGKSVTCTFTNSSLQIEVSKRAWLGNTIPSGLGGELPSGSAVADGASISWLFTVKNTGALDYRVSGISDNYVSTPITCAQSLTGTFKSFASLTQSERTITSGSSLYCKASGTLAF